ncbi:MAG: hypothetical protein NT023_24245, partial [Armatimonadetes bacterium]|nr:hypothetical protein [Armatimonadota bacterium]
MRRGDTARIIGIVALCLFVCAAAFAQPQKSKQYLVTVWVFQPRLKRMPSQDEISQSSMKFTLLRNADKMSPAPSDSDLLKQLRSLNPHLVFEKL